MSYCVKENPHISKKFDNMFVHIVIPFSEKMFNNFNCLRVESIVFSVGEILRYIISNDTYFSKVLNIKFFNSVYKLCACDKFIVSNEMFHILFYMFDSDKVDMNIFRSFFLNNSKEIMANLIETINYFIPIEETYLVERDTLVVSFKL